MSLLESDSVYLPFNIPASPVILRRPFSAPEREQSQVGRLVTTSAATATTSSTAAGHPSIPNRVHKPTDAPLGQRPQTSAGSHTSPVSGEGSSRYESLEQRPIRPLNQQIARSAAALGGGGVFTVPGGSRPSFEIARPLSSSSEPSVVGRSHHSKEGPALPTSLACSQDYESSGEQTTGESESESAAIPVTTASTSQPVAESSQAFSQHSELSLNPTPQITIPLSSHPQPSEEPASSSDGNSHVELTPSTREKLNHIRSVAGSRRSAGGTAARPHGLRDKAAAVARIRDGIPSMRTTCGSTIIRSAAATTTSTVSTTTASTVTASSLAASAVMRAHKLKSTTRQAASHHGPPDLGGGDGPQTSSVPLKKESSNSSMMLHKNVHQLSSGETPDTVFRGLVNSHLGGGDSKELKSRLNLERMEAGDSGFLSRPPSEVVKDEPQHSGKNWCLRIWLVVLFQREGQHVLGVFERKETDSDYRYLVCADTRQVMFNLAIMFNSSRT